MSRSPRRSGGARPRRASRVALRPLTEHDVEAVASWCEGAEELRRRLDDANQEVLAITSGDDGAPIGMVEYRLGVPEDGWLTFGAVDLEPRLRGLGLESEAVRVLEQEMASTGRAVRFCAQVDKENGLGLYFWLRLGYRPAGPGELPWPGGAQRGIMPMVRAPGVYR